MKWSWRIARISGIDIHIHSTFLILVGWIGLNYWLHHHRISAVLEGIGFIIALFACVLLHELGHALTAQRFGIATRDITLLPIGGVARLDRMPEDPIQELLVALAGPMVNVVIAILLWLLIAILGHALAVESVSMTGGSFLTRLLYVNVALVIFNMLPAFPMDGGRVLRALLATRMEYSAATQVAASVGQAMALAFGFIGLFSNPFLVFIAFFVWIGAGQEASMVQIKTAIGGIPVRNAMITEYQSLRPTDRLAHAIELTLTGSQKDFPIVDDEAVVGVLTQSDMLAGLSSGGKETAIGDVMQRNIATADSHEMLEAVLARLHTCDCPTLPVTHNGVLVGIITMDNIGELLRIQAALRSSSRAPVA